MYQMASGHVKQESPPRGAGSHQPPRQMIAGGVKNTYGLPITSPLFHATAQKWLPELLPGPEPRSRLLIVAALCLFSGLRIGKGIHCSQHNRSRAAIAIERQHGKARWKKTGTVFRISEPDCDKLEVDVFQTNGRWISSSL